MLTEVNMSAGEWQVSDASPGSEVAADKALI